ncbi:MAG: hypothetical protein KatS3mg089_0920 [Patescibacteria group bacterium]|nr:MAG: hypothetical protein KatS3mg089_0920 [Patescibacteria group bacterium]
MVILNETGDQAILTASKSGSTKFLIDNNGNVGIGTTTITPGFTFDNIGRGRFSTGLSIGTTATTNTLELSGTLNQTSGQVTFGGNVDATSGLDVTGASLTVGGSAFTVTTAGVITGTSQTLTSTGNALTLSGAGANISFSGAGLAQITTAASQHLALMPGGNVGIGTTTPQMKLDVAGAIGISGTTVIDASRNLTNIAGVSTHLNPTTANTYNLGTGTGNQYLNLYAQNIYQNGIAVCDANGNNCPTGGNAGPWTETAGIVYLDTTSNKVSIGDTTTEHKLEVEGAITGKALVSLWEKGDQDILVASNSATPTNVFRITNNGSIISNGTITASTTNTINSLSINNASITNAVNLTASGTITFSGLTPNRLVTTDPSSNLTTSISSANVAASVTDETGTGNLVFNTSPSFTTSITTGSTSFSLLNTTATTINAFGAATTLNIGANSGTLTLGNPTVVGTQTTQNLWNTTATTINFAGAATTLNMGASSGTTTINNATLSLPNATSVNIAGASAIINLSSSTGAKQIQTGGTTNLALMPGGNVGIGTTNPGAKLEVNGTSDIVQLKVKPNGSQTANLIEVGTGNLTFAINGSNNVAVSTLPSTDTFLRVGSTGYISFNSSSAVYGITTTPVNFGSGNVVGISAGPVTNNSGAVSAITSIYGSVRTAGGVSNIVAAGKIFEAGSPTISSGGITTLTGLYINQQKVSGVTTGYGIYQVSSADLNYFAGNVGIGTTAPVHKLELATHTTAAGGIGFGTDVELYRGAANTLYLASGDSLNLVSGNLQVAGTTVITSGRIIQAANGSAASPSFTFASDTNTGIFGTGADVLALSTAGVERLRVDASGNVGINTTSPSYKLDVQGGSGIVAQFSGRVIGADAINTNEFVTLGQLQGGSGSLWLDGGDYLYPNSSFATNVMVPSGRLGIGLTSTPFKLEINGNDPGKALVSLNYTGTDQNILVASQSGNLKFAVGYNGNITSATGTQWLPTSDSTTALNIANAAGTSFVTFDSTNQRVGIGTTAPTTKLELGSGQLAVPLGSATTPSYTFSGDLNTGIWSSGADTLNFSTGGSERIRIISNGNVGIGTTGPTAKLQIEGSGANIFLSNTTSKYITFGAAGFAPPAIDSAGTKLILYGSANNNTNNPRYAMGIAPSELWYSSGGVHRWYTESAGTWTPRMTIDTSGNVGIGTTAPLEKLDVSGNATVSGNLTFSGARTIASRAFTQLTIGDTQTGNILFSPASGKQIMFFSSSNYIDSSGNLVLAGTTGITASGTGAGLNFSGTGTHIIQASAGTLQINAFTLGGAITGNNQNISSIGNITANTSANTITGFGTIGTSGTTAFQGITATLNGTGNALTLSGAGANIAFTGAGLAQITTAASQHLALMPGGNVGINTTSPSYKLDVQGGSGIVAQFSGRVIGADAINTNEFVTLGQLQGGSGSLWLDGGDYLYPNSSFATNVMVPSGRLGVGLSSTPFKLEITGADAGKALASFNYTGTDQNILVASQSGTLKFAVGYNGNITSATGTKWLPTSDSTTALNIANSSGTSFVTFDTTNQRVGIGTTAPGATLDVSGTDTLLQDIRFVEASGINYIQSTNNRGANTWQPLHIGAGYSGSDIKLAIDSTGNVGIGTTGPGQRLDVQASGTNDDSIRLTTGNADGGLRLKNTGTGGVEWFIDSTSGSSGYGQGKLAFVPNVGSTPTMTLSGSNVGISTTAPGALLDVRGNVRFLSQTNNYYRTFFEATTEGGWNFPSMIVGQQRGIVIKDRSGLSGGLWLNGGDYNAIGSRGGIGVGLVTDLGTYFALTSSSSFIRFHDGQIIFYGNTGLTPGSTFSPTERIRIDATGNVGIGTTNPTEKLEVVGDVRLRSDSDVNTSVGSGVLQILNSGGTAGIHLDANEIQAIGNDLHINNDNQVNTHINNLVHITTGGNVGIGTTGPVAKLDVAGLIKGSSGFSSDGTAKVLTYRLSNSTTNSGDRYIGRFTGSQSNRIKITIIGQDGYSGSSLGRETVIYGQFNNNNDLEGQWYNLGGSNGGAITDVKVEDMGANDFKIYITHGQYFEAVVTVEISGGTFTPADSLTSPTAYTSLTKQFIVLANTGIGYENPGTAKLAINGNVGIGTTNPSYKLDVQGGSGIVAQFSGRVIGADAVNTNEFVTLGQLQGGSGSLWLDGGDYLYPNSSFATNVMVPSGRLGIGLTSTPFKLEISGNDPGKALVSLNYTGTDQNILVASQSGNLKFAVGYNGNITSATGTQWLPTSDSTTALNIANAAGTSFVTFDSTNQRVGIGTTAPTTKLELGSGQLAVPLGSATTPSYTFSGDLNTGIWSSGADTLNFSTGGSERIRIISNGNVGIGTTAPVHKLELATHTTAAGGIGFGTDVELYRGAANTLYLASGDSLNLVSGNLQVAGTTVITSGRIIQAANGSAASPSFTFASDTNTGIFGTGADVLAISTAGVERLRVDASGNVGINTTSPSYKLDVQGGSGIVAQFSGRVIGADAINTNEFVTLGQLQGGSGSLWLDGGDYLYPNSSFATNVMVPSGRLGIGLTSTPFKLEINGNDPGKALVSLNYTGTDQNILVASQSGNLKFAVGYNGNITSATGTQWLPTSDSTTALNIANAAGTSFVTFDSTNQRVGIGTTAPTTKLELGSGQLAVPLGSATTPSYTFSGDLNTGIWSSGADTLNFSTGGSERIRIISNGNVGIGTTNPGAKLEISNGTIGIQVAPGLYWNGSSMVSDNNWVNFDIPGTKNVNFSDNFIVTGGNVGIGTTSPEAKLNVQGGSIRVGSSSGNYEEITGGDIGIRHRWVNDPADNYRFWLAANAGIALGLTGNDGGALRLADSGANTVTFYVKQSGIGILRASSNDVLAFTSSGNVGIGTTVPAYKLDVVGEIRAFGSGDTRYRVYSSGTTGWVGYELRSSGLDAFAGGIFRNNADNNRVSIWSKNQEAISILDSGNVGIGTTGPG